MPHHPESKLNKIPPEFENNWFAQNPELLVGTTIYHTFVIDEETKEQQKLKKNVSQVRVGRTYFNRQILDLSNSPGLF